LNAITPGIISAVDDGTSSMAKSNTSIIANTGT
jgi:hypothetical protein